MSWENVTLKCKLNNITEEKRLAPHSLVENLIFHLKPSGVSSTFRHSISNGIAPAKRGAQTERMHFTDSSVYYLHLMDGVSAAHLVLIWNRTFSFIITYKERRFMLKSDRVDGTLFAQSVFTHVFQSVATRRSSFVMVPICPILPLQTEIIRSFPYFSGEFAFWVLVFDLYRLTTSLEHQQKESHLLKRFLEFLPEISSKLWTGAGITFAVFKVCRFRIKYCPQSLELQVPFGESRFHKRGDEGVLNASLLWSQEGGTCWSSRMSVFG